MNSHSRPRSPTRLVLLLLLLALVVLAWLRILRGPHVKPSIRIRSDLRVILEVAKRHHEVNGTWPASFEEMLCGDSPETHPFDCLHSIPQDPWGNRYLFDSENGVPTAATLGANAVPGGDGDDRDWSARLVGPELKIVVE